MNNIETMLFSKQNGPLVKDPAQDQDFSSTNFQNVSALERRLYEEYVQRVRRRFSAVKWGSIGHFSLPQGISWQKLPADLRQGIHVKDLGLRERSELRQKGVTVIALPAMEEIFTFEEIALIIYEYFPSFVFTGDLNWGIDHLVWDLCCSYEFGASLDDRPKDFSNEESKKAEKYQIQEFALLDKAQNIDLKDFIQNIEKQLIIKALQVSHGNKCKAGKLLGINRTTLIEKCKRLFIHY